MGKSRKSGSSELEILRGENRSLRKKIKQYQRKEHWYENVINVIAEEIPTEVKLDCPSCGKGKLKTDDFHFIHMETCDHCDYKRRIKKDKK